MTEKYLANPLICFLYSHVNKQERKKHDKDVYSYSTIQLQRSRLDSVEALINSIAESLNQHEQDLLEPQREKIVQCHRFLRAANHRS